MDLYVMTGESGAGKTTWIARMLELAASSGLHVAGLYTPAVFANGQKTGIDLVLLPDATRMPFATPKSHESGEVCRGWTFSDAAMDAANAHLAHCDDADPLLVDELGPLELTRGHGLTQALDLLDAQACTRALIVIRPSLLDAARARWGTFEILTPQSDVRALLANTTNLS